MQIRDLVYAGEGDDEKEALEGDWRGSMSSVGTINYMGVNYMCESVSIIMYVCTGYWPKV